MSRSDPERWKQIGEAIDRLLEVDASAREAWITRHLDDPTLARDVRAALREIESEEPSLEGGLPAFAPELTRLSTEITGEEFAAGARVGAWRLVRPIGEGGMGTVWRVERADGEYGQPGALKIVRRAVGPDAVERFLRERQTLARLEHPSIARLIDGGATPAGTPWAVMELVDGRPVTAWAEAEQPDLRRRLEVFLGISDAVAHAHRNLIVHRDLKPSNILVTRDGVPKLLDFGIAKFLEETGADVLETRTGFGLHTPQYASPEQLRGETVTTTADVYSLGLVLYELLSGKRPYELSSTSVTEQLRLVCDVPVPPPSQLAAANTARALRGDLDNIVLTAVRKEPERRYATVEAFAQDVRYYLEGLPVHATPDTTGYRVAKFARRHRWAVAASGVAVVALVTGLSGALWQAKLASAERDAARREARKAELATNFLIRTFDAADPHVSRGRMPTAEDILDHGLARLEDDLGAEPEVRATLMPQIAEVLVNIGRVEAADSLGRAALDLCAEVYGDSSLEAAEARRVLAAIAMERGEVGESLALLERAIADRRSILGPDHLEVARTLDDLAVAQSRMDRPQEALAAAEESRRILEASEEPPDGALASSLHHLAGIQAKLGDPRADATFAAAERAWLAYTDENHPSFASTLNDWALSLQREGRYEEALAKQQRALALTARAGPAEAADLAGVRVNLANLMMELGRHGEAEQQLRLALETLSGSPRGFELAAAHLNLGHALFEQARFDEARSEYEAGRDLFVDLLGTEHSYIAAGDAFLARVALAEGDPSALPSLERCAARLEEGLPATSSFLARAQLWRGEGEIRAGRPEEGIRALEEGLEALGSPERPTVLQARLEVALGHARIARGAPEGAELLRRGQESLARIRGSSDPEAVRAARALAELDARNSGRIRPGNASE